MDLIERAVEAGYDYYIWLMMDPDLAGIHDDPRFRELVRRSLFGGA